VDFEEAKRRLKIAVVLCVVGYGGWWLFAAVMMNSAASSAEAERKAAEELESSTVLTPDGRSVRRSERIEAAGSLGFKDPAAGLAAMRAIAAAPRDADEKAFAETRVTSMLVDAHRAAGKAKDWPRQAALWAEIEAAGADATRRRLISDDRAGWLARALSENDDASADTLAAAMAGDTANDEIGPRGALKDWRARQLEKWRAARASKDQAAAARALAAMSAWEPLDSNLAGEVFAAVPPAEILSLAQSSLKSGAYGQAALLARALLLISGDTSRAQALLDDAIMGLASEPAAARPPRLDPARNEGLPLAVGLYLRVNGPRRVEALGLVAGLLESWADSRVAAKPELCGTLYDEALRRLKEAASAERRPVAEDAVARLSTKAADARLAATLKMLETSPETVFAELRPLLRDDKNPVHREKVLVALRDAWRKARDTKAFDRFVDLSAFWTAEAGAPPFADPFHAEFKAGLVELVESSKKESLNKKVFALSLLADAFPADPGARDARRDATAHAVELARATTNRGKPPVPIGSSGLPGRTVALIENGTDIHILMIFSGPETFFVRVNPFRRGTVVLKDGAYFAGVATIKDDITPYAFEAPLASALVRQKFVISYSGPGRHNSQQSGFNAYGNWTLLRAPDGEKYTASPLNGQVRADPR